MIVASGFASSLLMILIAILLVIVVIAGVRYWRIFQVKKYTKFLSEDQFQAGIRQAQVIDLREAQSFETGHILGARNIPYASLKISYQQLRPDLPVYLYDQTKVLSVQAAKFLHKQGFQKLAILNEGYQKWDGKVKKG
ncbi:rhodanese-like domain-containing protein [Fructilactobacillus cliffordii]|uniref:Rhodanese-like domain-containing protein n=1 Tax=Fructilactobacillus cliffordii TaxID=2940299 RepID=A0A9Q8ZY77_9LACO|nr:rhodanese-like domain-containing protein [Fructilactobacillus cliffordii]USS86720.1 rhodanese-like domain-containing protein [Fructilactobacillus cliffordii]USS89716.1 rhodanese-like domain-containing protein [Fructilactobacillus cliffordii]